MRSLSVFLAFLRMGLVSFGGPIAHLGYFRDEFVGRRRWLDEARFAELVALGQVLPGPASTQVAIAIGEHRAGLAGAVAAWVGFALPSVAIMMAVAAGTAGLHVAGASWLRALVIVACAVVAKAVLDLARRFVTDARRAGIAGASMVLALLLPGLTFLPVALGAGAGVLLLGGGAAKPGSGAPERGRGFPFGPAASLALFAVLLVLLPALAASTDSVAASVVDRFYRAGALVFGGGHVILPLLRAEVVDPGLIDPDAFLAGYGAAQALPGPLFTFSAFLGTRIGGPGTGLLALGAIFLPSFLLLLGALPLLRRHRPGPRAGRALAGVHAAVVGLLASALVTPVGTEAIRSWVDGVLAAVVLGLLLWRVPAWALVAGAVLAGFLVDRL